MSISTSSAEVAQPHAGALYRAVWRWHFYAAIVVIPILLMLSVTGFFMLWFTAVAPEYGDRIAVARGERVVSIGEQQAAALRAYPDARIGQYLSPLTPDNPAIFRVDLADGARMVAIDPYTGAVLRDTPKDGTWNEWLTDIHGTLLIGGGKGVGDLIVELGASLGLVMVVTGLYLFWPRGTLGWANVLVPRFRGGSRTIVRSLHSVTGFWTSLALVFFLVSGLAWAGVWGSRLVQPWSTFPAEKWDAVPLSTKTHESLNDTAVKEVPWALEQTPLPQSGSNAGAPGMSADAPIDLASVAAFARTIGFGYAGGGRFQIAAPADETGVWTISHDSMSYDGPDPFRDRTTHIDRYTGRILADVRFEDYSIGGKAMAVGISLHEGMMGTWNVVLNFALVILIAFLCVSSVVMWWLRRPTGAVVAAPRYVRNFKLGWGAAVGGAALAVVAPVGGAAILAFALFDWLLPKRLKEAGVRTGA